MSRVYNYHKLARQTGFVKKPSAKQIKKDYKDRINSQYAYTEYTIDILNADGTVKEVIDKHDYHWGLFYVKGYKPIKLFKTREEAEADLNNRNEKLRHKYSIREILDWGEQL